MNRYYGKSPFFKFLRKVFKIEKPEYASFEGWDTWEEETKSTHPIGWWLTETFPDLLEKPAEWLIDPLYELRLVQDKFLTETSNR
jgi:hypothetical protein